MKAVNFILVLVVGFVAPAFSATCNSWPFPRHRNLPRNDAFLLQPTDNIDPSQFEAGRLYSWKLSGERSMMQYEVVFQTEPQYCGGGLLPVDETFEVTECKNKLISPKKQSANEAEFQFLAPQCGCFAIVALVTDEDGRSFSYFSEPEHKLFTNTCSKASSKKETETQRGFAFEEVVRDNIEFDINSPEMHENENAMEEGKDREAERQKSYEMFLKRKKSYEQNRRKWRRRQKLLSKFGENSNLTTPDLEVTTTVFQEESLSTQANEEPSGEFLNLGESRIREIFEDKRTRKQFCCFLGRQLAPKGGTDQEITKACSKQLQTNSAKLSKVQLRQCTAPFKRCCHRIAKDSNF